MALAEALGLRGPFGIVSPRGELRKLVGFVPEEEIVHPYARRKLHDGGTIADERLAEENAAKDLLTEMEKAGVEDPRFSANLALLRRAVVEHAEHEEQEEFPRLRQETSEQERRAMATAVRAAEALAPTHPHPGIDSTAKNLLLGPPTAIMDRTKDVLRRAMGKRG